MRASIELKIDIAFSEPVRALNQLLRLTPRGYDALEIRDWRVDVAPDVRLRRSEDGFGNILFACSHDGPIETVSIVAEGEVDIMDAAGVVRGLPERLPLDVFLRGAPATAVSPEIGAFAREAAEGESEPLAKLHALMAALHKKIAFKPDGAATAPRPAKAVFAAGAGDAREIAQAFVAGAHALAMPARFVSGLYLGADEVDSAGAAHGWAEAFVDGFGWIGFDAALNLCPREKHLRLAHGPDFYAAAPRRAAFFGYAQENVETALAAGVGRQAIWQIQQ